MRGQANTSPGDSAPTSAPAQVGLGAVLDGQRDARFVGREAEREALEAVRTGELPYRVVHLSGPGGIGKSELLAWHLRRCREAGLRVVNIAGRRVHPSSGHFLDVLGETLQLAPGEDWAAALAAEQSVLAVDNLELLAPIEDWLYAELLPRVPTSCHVVLAGRSRPSPRWLVTAGVGDLLLVMALRNFDADESHGYLVRRGVPDAHWQTLHDLTYGHPLALALFTELARHGAVDLPRLESYPDVVEALLDQLTQAVPSESHRTALRLSAIVRTTTEDLLARLIGANAPALFDWLRRLDFVQVTASGLEPHDLVRDALLADLRWRNKTEFWSLTLRALTYHLHHLSDPDVAERRDHLAGAIFVAAQADHMRDKAFVQPQFARYRVSLATPADWPEIESIVLHHQGPEAVTALRQWRSAPCAETRVLRGTDDAIEGFVTFLALDRMTAAEAARDPAAERAWRFVRSQSLEPGQAAFYPRFWLARETGQAVSPVQTSLFLEMFERIVCTAGMTFIFMPLIRPKHWIQSFGGGPNVHFPECDYEMDGRRVIVVGHDFRRRSVAEWVLAHGFKGSQLLTGPAPASVEPARPQAPPLAIERAELERAVRRALRSLDRPLQLADNPLLEMRTVITRAGTNAPPHRRAHALSQLLRSECERFQESPRDEDHYRVLCRAFLERPGKQDEMAGDLGLSYTTFRRRLSEAVERIADNLWRAEHE